MLKLHVSIGEEQELSNQLCRLWETESIRVTMEKEHSLENQEALHKFEETMKYDNGRYELRLPWKDEQMMFDDNYGPAENRFSQLVRKLQRKTTLYHRYNEVIQENLSEGIIEIVHSKYFENPIYYLPHHAIVREKASKNLYLMHLHMKKNSLSLNECLLPGPNLNPDLLSVLVKFKQHKVALTADIRKAFFQISLNEIDRDVLRFLWTMKTPVSMNDISILRMTRVPFGVSSSPFILAATTRNHLKKYEGQYPEVTTIINECPYVHDLITEVHTVKGALKLTQAAKELLSTAGMQLCKWTTNSAESRKEWTHRMSAEMINIKNKTTVKVLGLGLPVLALR